MRTILFFALSWLLFTSSHNISHVQQPTVALKGATGDYKSLDELKPLLVNESDKSIYLFPEDCGRAYLWLYYLNKTWRQSISKVCYGDIIEVKPGASYEIPALVWRPLRTYDGKLIEKKTFPGKYRMVIRYSLTDLHIKPSKPRLKVRDNPDSAEVSKETDVRELSAEFTIAP
jgi:hypothetical protein